MDQASNKGFFLIEVVVASAVIGTVLVLLLGAITNSVSVSQYSLQKTQAGFLLEEGAEAIKILRDKDWSSFANLPFDTTQYLVFTADSYATADTPEKIGAFSRSFSCSRVYRDDLNDIVEDPGQGVIDTNTKLCTVEVNWDDKSDTKNESLSFYLTNINS